jgi:hypothetical protein
VRLEAHSSDSLASKNMATDVKSGDDPSVNAMENTRVSSLLIVETEGYDGGSLP